MENQNNHPPPPETEAAPPPPLKSANHAPSPPHSKRNNSGDHISLSSPADSYSSPLHSKHNSEDHISLSPPAGNSPARSSAGSEHITINHSRGSSPEHERNRPPARSSLESEYITFDHGRRNEEPWPPAVVVRKDVYKGPMEDVVVVEEPTAVVNRAVLEEPKADPTPEVAGGGGGIRRRRVSPSLSILRRPEREKMVRKAALGFRVFGLLFCLVSFAVMAADRNQGWALDSFDRYKEFRYCMSVNVIGFVYSGAQALDMSYNLATGKYTAHHQQKLRHYLNFAADQMIAYLLISASSSAAIRIDDWQLNWGKDQFPDLATASVSMSFLAFVALALSSLISGYALCTSKSA
ncbi:CASP-like protein 4A1 [Salvia miltiorrhiza]|uniref:CASP-like protein 4A1 n=1 Tax=Salvia miltiorrhiza TaxID=226208 RepID=UPI0025AD9A9B|nr:CASP-like protein 4A1 [Salvia miltiorrhiza]